MAEVPKIVRERLRAGEVAANHPDADLLTAFAEHTLTGVERGHVLAHLAQCAECREVVALAAAPETGTAAAELQPLPAPPSRSWYRMTWAALAACVLVAAAVLLMPIYRRTAVSKQPVAELANERKQAPPAVPAAPEKAQAGKEVVANAKVTPGATPSLAKKAPVFDRRDLEANEAYVPKIASPAAGYIGGTVTQPAQAAPAPPASSALDAENRPAEAGLKKDEARDALGADQVRAKAAAPAAGRVGMAQSPAARQTAEVGGAQAVVEAQTASAPSAKAARTRPTANLVSATRLQWTVTQSGIVERSSDAQTWTPVSISSGANFRSVSAVGNDVWAGGQQGASGVVFHSADGGNTWKRQREFKPLTNDSSLSVTNVTFSDATHGALTVEGKPLPVPQQWITSDGGATWTPELGAR